MSIQPDLATRAYSLYRSKLREPGREAAIERIAIMMCSRPEIWADMGWPDVTEIKSQVPLGGSRADLVLIHTDASVTLVEVKPDGLGLRDYCTGIGQLAYQAVMAISVYQTFEIRRVLCLPGPIPPDLILAVLRSDITLLPLPTAEQWSALMDEANVDLAARQASLN